MYTTLFGGFLFSLTIEIFQYFVPQRNFGVTDIINTFGAALGALLAQSLIGRMILGFDKSRKKEAF
jgi:glycopeptide antibiotics resistance protein